MDLRWAFAPLYAASLGALVVAAFAFGRKDARAFMPQWPMAWFGLLAVLFALVALRDGVGPFTWVSLGSLGDGLGLALLVAAAGLAVVGSRVWVRADALRAEAPRSIDEGVAQLRAGRSPGWGVYRGRLASIDQVTSQLRGKQGGPAMVILGNAGEGTGTVLARRAWRLFALAGGLTVAAAWVLAG